MKARRVLMQSLLYLIILSWCCTLTASEPHRLEAEQQHMGTTFRIVAYAVDEGVGHAAIKSAFARIRELDERLSDYRSDSEVMQLCSTAPHAAPVAVSHDLWRVLRQAEEISRVSDGAF